jgi:4-amino-4-deoxy-L-arabinose transferase-like glycosyltransferase
VITKGVGFLPLLALIPYAILSARGWPARATHRDARWWLGPVFFLGAIGVWFVPMMLVTAGGGELLEYRNEILFHQTVTRYADAWHHHEPFWYYPVQVVPLLWLPLSFLLPWLVPRWRAALKADVTQRDTFVAVLLAWVALVLLFFSLSSGKRGVYVLPAVPALAMAAAPWLPEILRLARSRKLGCVLAAGLAFGTTLGALYFGVVDSKAAAHALRTYGVNPALPLGLAGIAGLVSLWFFRIRDGWLAYGGALAGVLIAVGFTVYPNINDARSGRMFTQKVEQASAGIAELGLAGAKEQYLLMLRRPTINFGHARWREREQEAADAAAWYTAKPGRGVLVDRKVRELCFREAETRDLGRANGQKWYLVTGGRANVNCVAHGELRRARVYIPPIASTNSAG